MQHSLADFWPRRGPVWDGLARSANGDLLLLEAKAHIPELASGRSQAGPESLNKITERLREVREFLAPMSTAEWTHTFYQYANRLAFLYFLRHVNQLPARLVFVYFVNARDVRGPASRLEWESALALMYAALGLPKRHPPPLKERSVLFRVIRGKEFVDLCWVPAKWVHAATGYSMES